MTTRALVRHVLDDDQRRVILAFGAEVEKLWVKPVAGQGAKRTLLKFENHYDWEGVGPGRPPRTLRQSVTTPTDDALAAMQRQFRIFILDDEVTHFLTIRKLVSRAVHLAGLEDPAGGLLKRAKAAWKLPMLGYLGCPVPGQDLLNWWFNAELSHRDGDKKAKLDALRAQVGEARLRMWLMFSFTLALSVLIEFHTFVRDGTDLYEGAPFASGRTEERP